MSDTLEKKSGWPIAIAAATAMTLSFFDRQVFSVLAPRVTADLHISNASYGWLGSAFAFAYLLGSPVAGALVARVGARRALLVSMVVWSAVSALHSLAGSFASLVVLRIALGLSEAPSFPGAVQAVRRVLPPKQITRGVSFVFVGISVGSLVAAPLATALAVRAGWRFAFLGTAAFSLVWLPIWMRMTSGDAIRARLDVGEEAERAERGAVIRNPHVLRALVALAAAAPLGTFADLWEAKYFADYLHISEVARGGYLVVGPIFYDVGAIAFAELGTRLGERRRPFVLAAAFASLAIVGLALTRSAPVAAVCVALHSLGRGGMFSLILAEMVACVAGTVAATATGLIAGARGLIGALTSIAIGHMLKHVGYPGVLAGLAIWLLPLAAIWTWWRPDERLSPTAPEAR